MIQEKFELVKKTYDKEYLEKLSDPYGLNRTVRAVSSSIDLRSELAKDVLAQESKIGFKETAINAINDFFGNKKNLKKIMPTPLARSHNFSRTSLSPSVNRPGDFGSRMKPSLKEALSTIDIASAKRAPRFLTLS